MILRFANESFPSRLIEGCRALTKRDGALIGGLLFEAYRGTVDDGGETLQEAVKEGEKTVQGGYGPLLWNASFIVDIDGQARAMSVVTLYDEQPLLAFSATHPQHQRQGYARGLIEKTLHSLAEQGVHELNLAVTLDNTPALRLYQSMGFVPYVSS